ncbi:unnamed protein product [Arctogadus glacialis]
MFSSAQRRPQGDPQKEPRRVTDVRVDHQKLGSFPCRLRREEEEEEEERQRRQQQRKARRRRGWCVRTAAPPPSLRGQPPRPLDGLSECGAIDLVCRCQGSLDVAGGPLGTRQRLHLLRPSHSLAVSRPIRTSLVHLSPPPPTPMSNTSTFMYYPPLQMPSLSPFIHLLSFYQPAFSVPTPPKPQSGTHLSITPPKAPPLYNPETYPNTHHCLPLVRVAPVSPPDAWSSSQPGGVEWQILSDLFSCYEQSDNHQHTETSEGVKASDGCTMLRRAPPHSGDGRASRTHWSADGAGGGRFRMAHPSRA